MFLYILFLMIESLSASEISAETITSKGEQFQQSHIINGAIAIKQNNTEMYANHCGTADHVTNKSYTTNTRFFIGSVTKQFTAAALLHVLWHKHTSIESLKESLHKPLSNYLPTSDSIWAGSMPEWANEVTLHQLLTHTSGIACYSDQPNFLNLVGQPISTVELTNIFKNEPLNFKPGERFHYCNSGYFLLGEVVARLSGKDLSDYLKEHFFTPFEMLDTFMPKVGSGKIMKESGEYPNLARGYNCGVEPNSPMVEIEKYFDNTFLNGVAGIVSTSNNLLIWNHKLYHNMVLPREVTELMLSEHVPMDPENSMVYYCYGIVKVKYPNGDVFTHGGDLYGFSTTLAYRPHDQLSFVASTNIIVSTREIQELQEKEHENLKHIKNQREYITKLNATIENTFPGFLAALENHRLIRLDELVDL